MHKFKFEDKEMIQIYITEEEKENKEIIEKIQQLKKQGLNVTVFVSGKKDAIRVIREILNHEKSKNIR